MNTNLVPVQPTGNPLNELIPASARPKVYAVFALVGLVAGAVVASYLAMNKDLPDWLTISVVVYNFLSAFFGALAGSNVSPAPVATVLAEPNLVKDVVNDSTSLVVEDKNR